MERCTGTSAAIAFDRRSTDQQKKRLVKRLTDLGYSVVLTPFTA
jgi:phenylpyruvate tautomerase PptA (4-oxalocrotonate tautomerase family)